MKIVKPFKNCYPNSLTQGFTLKQHEACDYTGKFGEFLLAPFDCRIERMIRGEKLNGNTQEVETGCGLLMISTENPNYRVSYWHCQPIFPVEIGELVKQGQPVAQMGNTGAVYGNGQFYSVAEREQEYSESTPSNLPKKGVHVHISYGFGDGSAEGTVNRDISKEIDWTIPVSYSLLDAISMTLKSILKIFKL